MSDDLEPSPDDPPSRLTELTTALGTAQREKTEAYLQSDWNRVWELTNQEIPGLEREIAALTGVSYVESPPGRPFDFDRLDIEILDSKGSLLNLLRGRSRSIRGRVTVTVDFSEDQRQVIKTGLENHVVFYQSKSATAVTVATLLRGAWSSDHGSERDAEKTAENAREGIDDLRLIIQDRARRLATES